MVQADSDALVIFGASGDLAAKMLFPALYGLSAAGRISVPIIGVTRQARAREAFLDHVRERIAWHRALLDGDRWHDPSSVPRANSTIGRS